MVLDSSFLIALMVEEEHSDFAAEILSELASTEFQAPALLVWEIANVLEKKVRKMQLSKDDRTVMLGRFDDLPIILHPAPDADGLVELAALCDAYGLTAYDAAYLALALEGSSALATLDRHLATAARAEGLTVHSPF